MRGTLSERAPIPREWSGRYAFALVRRGVVVRVRERRHGHAVAIDCMGPGALMPITAHHGALGDTGYAVTAALFCLYPTAVLEHRFGTEGDLARDLTRGLWVALARVERFAEARGLPRAEQRVISVLCALFERLGTAPIDSLPAGLQQRDIARLAGVRHESVCRTLGALERAGTIARRNGEIVALRPEELLAAAG